MAAHVITAAGVSTRSRTARPTLFPVTVRRIDRDGMTAQTSTPVAKSDLGSPGPLVTLQPHADCAQGNQAQTADVGGRSATVTLPIYMPSERDAFCRNTVPERDTRMEDVVGLNIFTPKLQTFGPVVGGDQNPIFVDVSAPDKIGCREACSSA